MLLAGPRHPCEPARERVRHRGAGELVAGGAGDVVTVHLASEQTYRMTSDHMRTVLVDRYFRT